MRSRLVVTGLAIAAAFGTAGCSPAPPPANETPDRRHEHPALAPSAVESDGMSIFRITSDWYDAHGRNLQLRDVGGRPMLLALVYTHCGTACPRIVQDMKRVEAALPDLDFVLVSIDPERDTPGHMKEFATGSRLDPKRWTLLSGADADLLVLATALGVRYRPVATGEFVHSNVITALAPDGTILFRQDGLGRADETIRRLEALGY
jgi:protein SCO1